MKNLTIPLIIALTLGFILITLMDTPTSQASPDQPPGLPLSDVEIYTSRYMHDGITSTSLQSIFGPNICTTYGDPFSPLNSIWAPGSYTYTYRIDIPADYPHDILRVEIFDPDSINNANSSATILRTNAAINIGGLDATVSGNCSSPYNNRKNPCYINTAETVDGTPISGLEFDQVNPLWYMRVDHNRGTSTPGQCGEPNIYTESYNTATLFELYYYRDNGDDTTPRVDLSTYIGQTGDGMRDNGDHNTDMQWVSPGADRQAYDYEAFFPGSTVDVEPGSATSFEIDLTTEIPNIVTDPDTGERHIYIAVTALSGSSNNSFEFWAGPPTYLNSVPSQVNDRNIFVRNNPGSHSSQGVNIFALGYLPQQSNVNFRVERPLINLTPEQAGESIYISLFDADTLAQPPITFYLDTIPPEDWSLTFGAGGIDPDGITSTVRCQLNDMGCNNQWIDPPYEIKLPNGTKDCDFSNPTPEACTPFYGGRLIANHHGGLTDTYGWQISVTQNETHDPTTGCEAFPMAIYEGIRSVTQAEYPTSGHAQAPPIPAYGSFIYHTSNMPLLQAGEGDVFLIYNGFGAGQFGWLSWNLGFNNANALADSLTWPGNSNDYTDHGDFGQPVPGSGFAHPVRGYIEPGDPTDQQLHIGDWIFSSTGGINSNELRTVLNEHISLGRTLRLPIWQTNQGTGNNSFYQASGFALFRIHGYNVTGGNGSWLLLEFIRLDDSCGQPGPLTVPITAVSIDGTTYTAPNSDETFTASILPLNATQPVSYTWEATDFAPVTHSGGISDTITFNWATAGTKTITVTAENAGSIVTETHTLTVSDLVQGRDLTIIGTPQLLTPLPLIADDPVTFAVTIENLGNTAVSGWYYLSLFANPTTIEADGIPFAQADASEYVFELDPGASKTIQITVYDGLALPGAGTPHQIYAMVDADKDVLEVSETNNVSSPASLSIDDFVIPPTAVSIDGSTVTYRNENLTLTASILPLNATQPVSYTWEATDFAPVTHSGGISDTITFNWATAGTKTITVTAQNAGGSITDTHTVTVNDLVQGKDLTIIGAPQLITPLPIDEGQPLTFAVTVRNNGTENISSHWFVDLFVNPATINPDGIPVSESNGFTTLSALNAGESKTVNITLDDGLPMHNTPHQIYAMVDTFKNITEANETNNVSESLPFGANNFIEWQFIYLPVIIKD